MMDDDHLEQKIKQLSKEARGNTKLISSFSDSRANQVKMTSVI